MSERSESLRGERGSPAPLPAEASPGAVAEEVRALRRELLETGRSEWWQRVAWQGSLPLQVASMALALGSGKVHWVALGFYAPMVFLILLRPLSSLWIAHGVRQRLRQQIAGLSLDDQLALLAPLRDERRNDAWRLVAPVLRDLDLPSVLVPAPAPSPAARELAAVTATDD